ncbi:MAG: hypothetical protein MGF17_00785 [Trichodesmium sp. MAG_R04]|nr:hypothetical protein [Trichodesmium sp. MAG_R04]
MKRQPASELRLGCFPVPLARGGSQAKLLYLVGTKGINLYDGICSLQITDRVFLGVPLSLVYNQI